MLGSVEIFQRQNVLEDFGHILVTKERDIPQEEPVITVSGAAFAASHNIQQ